MEYSIGNFLDEEGRIKQMPAKYKKRMELVCYVSHAFECGVDYTEEQVNDLLRALNTVGEHVTLRRELVDMGALGRTKDGSRYWKNTDFDEAEFLSGIS